MLIAGSCKLTQNLLIQKSVFGHLCLGIKGERQWCLTLRIADTCIYICKQWVEAVKNRDREV